MRGLRAPFVAACTLVPFCGVALGGVADTAWLIARSGYAAPSVPGYSFNGLFSDNASAPLPAPMLAGELLVVSGSLRQGSLAPPADRGLWLLGAGGQSWLIARQGGAAPGLLSGTTFQSLSPIAASADGRMLFAGTVSGPGVVPGLDSRAYWLANTNSTSLVVREAQVAPETTPVGYFRALTDGYLLDGSSGGDVAVRSLVMHLPGASDALPVTYGNWVRRSQQMEMASWSYGAAPGIANGWMAQGFDTMSCSGLGACAGQIYGPAVGTVIANGVSITTDWCVWRTSADTRTLIARKGSPAPGTAPGVVFRTLPSSTAMPMVNGQGEIVFWGMVAGPGINSGNWTGLWRSTGAGVSLVARGGNPATAAGTGVTFGGLTANSSDGTLWVMANGDAVFATGLGGTGVTLANCTAVWKRSPTNGDTLIARAGVSNPALPSGTTLVRTMLPRAMKAAGDDHVMFTAQLSGTGVTTSNDDVLLRHTAAGGLQVLAREGTTIGSHILKSYVNNGADMQITASGFAAVPAMFSPASNPSATPVLGVLGVSPSGVARVLAVQNHNIALSDGTFPVIGQLRIAPKSAISEDGRVAMAASFGSGTPRDEGVFVVTIDSGFVPPAPCLADYNNSGSVTSQDIFDFLTDWFLGNADFDQSGVTEVTDIFAYFSVYFAGCD